MNLREQIIKGVNQAKDKPAFISENDIFSYHDLHKDAESLAEHIRSEGIEPGSYLCLEVDKNRDFLVGLLTSIITQVVLIPLKYGLKEKERASLIAISTPEYLLTIEQGKWHILKTTYSVPEEIKAICPEGGFVRPTSGTTNASKGVLISSHSAQKRVNASITSLDLTSSDKVLCLMAYPYHFVASLLSFIAKGITIITPSVFSEEALSESCEDSLPTIIYASPYHFSLLTEMNLERELKDVRLTISTGTKLPSMTRAKFAEKYKKPITEIFGIIEVGLALQNTNSDVTLSVIPPIENEISKEGALLLKGPGMFDAYLSPFRPCSDILNDSWFSTGDLAERTESGDIIILGRSNSAIHIGAHKVFPEEIEETLLEFTGITNARVYAIPHSLFGSEIQAEITVSQEINEKEVLSYLRKRLGSLKTPKNIKVTDSIEQTLTGKTKRSELSLGKTS